jgi:hypothetical protein
VDCNLTMVFALLLLRCHYQGWEETVNASVTFLLKTTLAKTAKEGSSSLSGTTLEVKGCVFDTAGVGECGVLSGLGALPAVAC